MSSVWNCTYVVGSGLTLNMQPVSPGQLASNQELKRLFEGNEDIKSGFHAIAKLAWGCMIYITGDDNNQTHGEQQRAAWSDSRTMHVSCPGEVLCIAGGAKCLADVAL